MIAKKMTTHERTIKILETNTLFGGVGCVVAGRISSSWAPLYVEEEIAVQTASIVRRREFATGRALARSALLKLGLTETAIPMLASGAPAWPTGVVGSISHSKDICAVVVAKNEDIVGLGIDIEFDNIEEARLARYICDSDELAQMADILGDRRLALRLLFSAKEAFFKATPIAESNFGFRDVRVHIARSGSFCARDASIRFVRKRGIQTYMSRYEGRWSVVDDAVLVGVKLSCTMPLSTSKR